MCFNKVCQTVRLFRFKWQWCNFFKVSCNASWNHLDAIQFESVQNVWWKITSKKYALDNWCINLANIDARITHEILTPTSIYSANRKWLVISKWPNTWSQNTGLSLNMILHYKHGLLFSVFAKITYINETHETRDWTHPVISSQLVVCGWRWSLIGREFLKCIDFRFQRKKPLPLCLIHFTVRLYMVFVTICLI